MSLVLLKQSDGELITIDVYDLPGRNRPSKGDMIHPYGNPGPQLEVMAVGTEIMIGLIRRGMEEGNIVPEEEVQTQKVSFFFFSR